MKKLFFIAALMAAFTALTGCENSDESSVEETLSKEDQDSMGEVITFEDWIESDTATYKSEERSPLFTKSRATNTDITVYGYTTKSSSGNKKVIISKNLASHFGIVYQAANPIYILERVTAKYELTIDGLSTKKVRFSSNDSPKCGLYPDYTDDDLDSLGYTVTQKGNNVTMTTSLIHLVSDLSGRSYNRWYPCKPEELEWNYSIYSVD